MNYSPSQCALRKTLYDERNKFNVYADWVANVIKAAQLTSTFLVGKKIDGYVQRLNFHPSFEMQLHFEAQLKVVNDLPPTRSELHIDASGGFLRNYENRVGSAKQLQNEYLASDMPSVNIPSQGTASNQRWLI